MSNMKKLVFIMKDGSYQIKTISPSYKGKRGFEFARNEYQDMIDKAVEDDSVKVIRIQSEVMAQKLIIERELAQSLQGLRKRFDEGEISAEEHDAILSEVNKRYTGPDGVLTQLSVEMAQREKLNKLFN